MNTFNLPKKRTYQNAKMLLLVPFFCLLLMLSFSCRQSPRPQPKIKVGADAPDFALPDQNNKLHQLSEYKNKTILLDFWASWCAPCRKKNQDVVALYNKYKGVTFANGSQLEIISVSQDNNEAAWLQAIADDGLLWPAQLKQRLAGLNEASVKYDVQYIPTTFLINSSGKIMLVNPSEEDLEAKLEEMR